MAQEDKEILEQLAIRTISYFKDDLLLDKISSDITIEDVKKIDYCDITTFIALSGQLSGTLGMSVPNDVAFDMVKNFMFGEMSEEELQELSSENIAETLNITVGNILPELEVVKAGGIVNISTPYTMHNCVTITKKKDGIMLLVKLKYEDKDILLSYFK